MADVMFVVMMGSEIYVTNSNNNKDNKDNKMQGAAQAVETRLLMN